MLLRRITQHVKEQNWFAVGLDMAVVIIGIFVGLQLSDLNENRKNAIKGQGYLDRIADELEQDIRFFGGVIQMNERTLENAQFLLDTVDNEDLVREDPTRFITSLAFTGASMVVNVSDNTIEEIKFSGNLELIKDEELRNEIVDYYDFIEISQTFSHLRQEAEMEYQRRIAGVLAPEHMEFNRDPNYSEVDALLVYERFLAKPEFIEWIPIVMSQKNGTIGFSRQSQRNAEELLAKIRGEELPAEEETGEEEPAN